MQTRPLRRSSTQSVRDGVPTLKRSSLYTSADKLENTVISAWMPISRPWTVTIRQCKCLIQASCQPVVSRPWIQGHLLCPTVCHPWTLDFGIHAEKTDPPTLVYNDERWSVGTIKASAQPRPARSSITTILPGNDWARAITEDCASSQAPAWKPLPFKL